jgi:hypothetical protein
MESRQQLRWLMACAARGSCLLLAAAGITFALPALAGDETGAETTPECSARAGGRWSLTLAPAGNLYPEGMADPYRAVFGLLYMHVSSSDIPDSGSTRFGLKAGGRFGLLRLQRSGTPERGWQLGIEAGFVGVFDVDRGYDNIGWDGVYGLMLTHRLSSSLALKLGAHHTSAHVGDEYQERVGRRRIEYTREEARLGLSWSMRPRWRSYVELGWGYDLRTRELQEPGRAQVGLSYAAPDTLWSGRAGWYAALDLSAFEERDWELGLSTQVGLSIGSDQRRWRLGLEYYDGRCTLGEFFFHDESYLALGLWVDL